MPSDTTPKPTPPPKAKCDNHPKRDAVISTTRGNRHSLVSLCAECVPAGFTE